MSNYQHLINELEHQHDAKVVQTTEKSYPVFTLTVHYHPVQKTPMDILMKMMLIAFQKAPIKATDVLANILLVEPLFIEDLTSKMKEASLITKQDDVFTLTEKGLKQLKAGVFEERLELVTEETYYSPIHQTMLSGDMDAIFELEDIPEPLSYAPEQIDEINEQNVIEVIQDSIMKQEQDNDQSDAPQAFITELESFEIGSIQDIPIIIFILKEEKSDRLFARVFNHFTNEWDPELEQYVTENEKTSWTSLK